MVDMVIVLLSTVFLAVIYAWHRAYPRPYEDVPYSTQSERRLLGDIPDIVQFVKDGNAPEDLIADRCRRLNSPIIQLFFEPFSRPLIFLDDTAAFAPDAVWAAFLGSDLHGVRDELDELRNQHNDFCLRQPAFVDSPAALPPTVKRGLFRAIEYLNSTMNVSVTSLSGWYRYLVRQRPIFRRYWTLKTNIINEHI
ncbi:hypothetical protein E4U22_007128 [Claviceps purpurea]|nr:hypothetical protein E4U22_007128 [Claviceps purpurea]